MAGGKAHGQNRQYQVECRDVLMDRNPKLIPWDGDGIDIPFDFSGTQWILDIALNDGGGQLVVAECRRTVGAVKQEDMGAFAQKVEGLRKTLNIPVAGIFITKSDHQIGAVKVADFFGIQTVILDEGSIPPGFSMTFLRYDADREKKIRDFLISVPSGSLGLTGNLTTLIHSKPSGESESR